VTTDNPDSVPERFRRQMQAAGLLRWCLMVALVVAIVAYCLTERLAQVWIAGGLALLVAVWTVLVVRAVGQVRRARRSSLLLQEGRVEEARRGLLGVLNSLTPLRSITVLACHYLAVASHLSRKYAEAAAICRELLAHRLGPTKSVGTATRFILADSLLMLGEVDEALPVVQAIDTGNLSLNDRLTFLPIELHCQLAADQGTTAAQALPEKVRLAELLEPPTAALTHAFLAEACRRTNQGRQRDFLLRRAALLADLEPLVSRYQPVLGHLDIKAAQSEPTGPADTDRQP
jgi:hypothetical protein